MGHLLLDELEGSRPSAVEAVINQPDKKHSRHGRDPDRLVVRCSRASAQIVPPPRRLHGEAAAGAGSTEPDAPGALLGSSAPIPADNSIGRLRAHPRLCEQEHRAASS